jgi:hypothetical protein
MRQQLACLAQFRSTWAENQERKTHELRTELIASKV